MMDMEHAMLESLDGTFTTYAGAPDTNQHRRLSPRFPQIVPLPRLSVYEAILSLKPISSAPSESKWQPSMANIVVAVTKVTGISVRDIRGPMQFADYARARQIFFWICRNYTPLTYPQIGRWCGNRDHSTVVHGVQKITRNMGIYKADILAIKKLLGAGE